MTEEPTPIQAAFLMRHLSPEDRIRMIREAGAKVIDLCNPDTRQAAIKRKVSRALSV